MKKYMKDLCKWNETSHLKVEADIGAEAIWCNKCYCNFDIEYVPISIELKAELMEWILRFDKLFRTIDGIVQKEKVELEEEHNKQGFLTEKVKKELEGLYEVSFSPSKIASRYST
ncbi:hypothetical protein MHB48_11800 [Psychrobacillus sp. FSL H8-0483]|uniref:hypothetical protein n=1 Tax=Psychrobacillus sp. FSL H8-0483 TaxID=2921389 RepID=UPI00315AF3BA